MNERYINRSIEKEILQAAQYFSVILRIRQVTLHWLITEDCRIC